MNRLNRPRGPGGLAALLGLAMLTGSVQAQEPTPLVFSVTSDDHPSEIRKRYREFHRIIEEQLNNRLSDQQVVVQLAIAPTYEVVVDEKDDPNDYGLIVVKEDSPVQSLADLKGKSIAFVNPYATAGRYHAQAYLEEIGGLGAGNVEGFVEVDDSAFDITRQAMADHGEDYPPTE